VSRGVVPLRTVVILKPLLSAGGSGFGAFGAGSGAGWLGAEVSFIAEEYSTDRRVHPAISVAITRGRASVPAA
jgi:hypothetical protein